MTATASPKPQPRVGFNCSYAPLPLIHAAGFVPQRLLPLGDAPDQAGTMLHDNLCPEVKRILDRRLSGDYEQPLAAVVFVNSCDAMRRLANAWAALDEPEPSFLLDLPVVRDVRAAAYFAGRLALLRDRLAAWSGAPVTDEAVWRSIGLYDELQDALEEAGRRAAAGTLPGGRAELQRWHNRSVTEPVEETIGGLGELFAQAPAEPDVAQVPLLVFGNVLPDPEAASLLESCGARVVADDLCTGSRQLTRVVADGGPPLSALARALCARPLCARTIDADDGGALARQIITRARASGARGAIAHVLKFCDPYLIRLPALRAACQAQGLPLLVLEGDCTTRSLGQQRTRIEAFVEMLGESQ